MEITCHGSFVSFSDWADYWETSLPSVPENSRRQQLERLQHLQRVCSDDDIFKNVMYKKKSPIVYYSSSKYNFSYCKVHKAGGTFWTQVFTILSKGAADHEDVFRLSKYDVHHTLGQTEKRTFDLATSHASRTVLVSRDPYSRLFSAFIDKLFLPMKYKIAVKIVNRQRRLNYTCANDLTFEEFLTSIIDRVTEGKTIDIHWTPIVNLCKPCDVNAFAVVKQETFTVDVEYVLKEVEIANNEFEVIYDALHNHRIEANVPGIVTATIAMWKRTGVDQCMDGIELARRFWTAFQIQGYIKDDIPFPSDIVETHEKAEDPDFLTNVILETIKEHPMTPNEAKLQRLRALVDAFDGVNKDILDQVKMLYKQDFILFDYSFEPPTLKH